MIRLDSPSRFNRPVFGLFLFIAPMSLLPAAEPATPPPPSVVQLTSTGPERWELRRNGKPYFIQGVGGSEHLETAASFGVNSIRTWGVGKDTKRILDRAHALDLSVCVGLWLGHKRHGFNYGDPGAVDRQLRETVAAVHQFKDHPAVLCWGVGNEVETGQENDPRVWQAINATAKAIKAVDPHHPTLIVIAELGVGNINVKRIKELCPDIDIVGLNAYDGARNIAARYAAHKIGKPCIITEYGPPLGSRDRFGMVKEPTSTAKAKIYADIVDNGINAHPGFCLGGYSFVWGSKTEMTDTYFGQFLASGERLAGAEIYHELFGAPAPANRCPRITTLNTSPASRVVHAGESVTLTCLATDPDNDALRYRWELKHELRATVGGDHLHPHKNRASQIQHDSPNSNTAIITAPPPGKYRVYAYVTDNQGNAATATTTIVSKRKIVQRPLRRMPLPLSLYSEKRPDSDYSPSGVMGGNAGAIRMTWDHATNPHSGATCLRIQAPANAWSGVNWQHPPNDWGERAGGYDATGAKKLTFWARGATGGEKITFAIGGIGPEANYPDSVHRKLDLTLTPKWTAYSIDLTGADLTRIKTGFHWSASATSPIEFFLDDIRYE